MANWQRRIDLKDIWGEGNLPQLAARIAKSLRDMVPLDHPWAEPHREELAEQFDELAQDPSATVAEFDYLMHDLYDWGDTEVGPPGQPFHAQKKCCWIAT